MGYIADITKQASKSIECPMKPYARPDGQSLWRTAFGQNTSEAVDAQRRIANQGGSVTGSTVSSAAATARLIQALRSMAPGGWSDNRWEQTNHFVGSVYVAIDRTSKMLQQAEFAVYKKDHSHPDGKRPITPEDPPEGGRFCRPYDLVELLEKPNQQDSFGSCMYRRSQQKRLTGSALEWMVPNSLGVPMELYVIPTAIMIPQTVVSPAFPQGFYRCQPVYPYGPFSSYPTPNSAVGAPIPAEWVLKYQYPHPLLRYEGYSPLTGLRQQIDQLEQMDRSRWYSMFKSINPSAVLNFDKMDGLQPLSSEEIDRIHAEWANEFQGTQNHGSLIVGTPGATLEQWGQRPIDMDYPAGWEQVLSFILGGGFGITKPAAGMVEDSNYSTLYATIKQLYLITLQPECDDMASVMTRHLAPYFGDDLIIEIRCKRIDDPEVVKTKIDTMIQGRLGTVNEARKMLELPIIQEEWGNERLGEQAEQEMPFGEEGQEGNPLMAKGTQKGEAPKPVEVKQTEKQRPKAGHVAKGSLGPRGKSLELGYQKILGRTEQIQQVLAKIERKQLKNHVEQKALLTNGNGKHK